jgi:hypothetical protein
MDKLSFALRRSGVLQMSRKSLLLCGGILLVLAGGVGAGLSLLVRHVPAFYRQSTGLPEAEQKKLSEEFITEFCNFFNGVRYEKVWGAKFTEGQINAYLEDDFRGDGTVHKGFPESIRAPRISLRDGSVRLAFRYGTDPWSIVISVHMRPWLVVSEPNVVAVELRGVYAGALPISAQSLLESIAETAHHNNIEVIWYRHQGYPVALLRFQADRPHPTIQLQRLVLQAGVIDIAGRAIEAAPVRASLSRPGTEPAAN